MEKIKKRTDYLSWDEYFMGVSLLSAQRSKDPNTQVGACIVNNNNKIVGIGYNGFPTGCSDDELPWEREGEFLDVKYPYVCHAELNAILNSHTNDLTGCRLYVALFPCNECAKSIIQSGIREVVYLFDKYAHTDEVKAAKRLFQMAGVRCRQLKVNKRSIVVHFTDFKTEAD
jgi:dCMP deaminase